MYWSGILVSSLWSQRELNGTQVQDWGYCSLCYLCVQLWFKTSVHMLHFGGSHLIKQQIALEIQNYSPWLKVQKIDSYIERHENQTLWSKIQHFQPNLLPVKHSAQGKHFPRAHSLCPNDEGTLIRVHPTVRFYGLIRHNDLLGPASQLSSRNYAE